jgi:hypothetical protein
MPPQQSSEPRPERFTVTAEVIDADVEAWHLTVHELPDSWTVAFSRAELETAARRRIALDLGCSRDDFDIAIETHGELYLERRASRRDPAN